MSTANLVLYELAGARAEQRFSPHCWKVLMALAHKGLSTERVPVRFGQKNLIAFSGQGLVPVLVHDGTTVSDSWRIAVYLEERFPQKPSLFGGSTGVSLTHFINHWSDRAVMLPLARLLMLDILHCTAPEDRAYFRTSREERVGMSLEEFVADQPAHLAELRRTLQPLRVLLRDQSFIAGDAPAYADYCVFGYFMWARCVSRTELLERDDPIAGWRARLLGAFDGLAAAAPCAWEGQAA